MRPALTIPLWILAVLATAMFLRYTRSLCIPIALAVLISFALAPAVRWLQRFRLPLWAAVTLLLGTLGGATVGGAYAMRDNIADAIRDLPRTIQQVREGIEGRNGSLLQRVREAMKQLPQSGSGVGASTQAGQGPSGMGNVVVRGSAGAISLLGHLVVIAFLVFFLLLTGASYRERIIALAGPRLSARREASQVLQEITTQIERFLLVRVATAALVGVATWLALLALGGPSPALWGAMAGLFNSIPYFGPLIVSGGLFIVGISTGSVGMGLTMAAVALAITTLEGWLLTPPLLGKAARMHTLAVFIGLLVWSWAWGIWGTILAVPMLVVVKSVSDHVDALRPVSVLLSE